MTQTTQTTQPARLIYADSESCADMLYATGLFAPDPFLFFQEPDDGKTHVVVSALEIDRARRVARVDVVHEWGEIRKRHLAAQSKLRSGNKPYERPEESALIHFFIRERGVEEIQVPGDFPLGLADRLRQSGLEIKANKGTFWSARAIKTAQEVAHIEEALHITALGMRAGIELIRASTIGSDGLLYHGDHDGKVLTSERVRGEINAELVRHGAIPSHTIVAGGDQGADPHEEGFGPLAAHRPIIIDVFPRVERTGYFGDMTRTVCRGQADKKVKRAWQAVHEGQALGFTLIKNGVSGRAVHRAITDLLTKAGFPTGPVEGGRQGGFFHGTGHGLGLEIHEAPRIGQLDSPLESGHVVTVEPGLYYPDWGGVRLEDVVLVTDKGCRNLTDMPKFFEI